MSLRTFMGTLSLYPLVQLENAIPGTTHHVSWVVLRPPPCGLGQSPSSSFLRSHRNNPAMTTAVSRDDRPLGDVCVQEGRATSKPVRSNFNEWISLASCADGPNALRTETGRPSFEMRLRD